MKRISFWASRHRKLSWVIIFICQTVLYYMAMYTGALMEDAGKHIPLLPLIILLSAAITCIILKPQKFLHKKYAAQKAGDVLIGFSVFIGICFFYNNSNRVSSFNTYTVLHGSLPKDNPVSSSSSLSRKERRHQITASYKMMRLYQKKEKAQGDQIALTILAALGSLLLLSFVAALSCSLSCSGSDALALLVGIGGVVGVVWLTVFCIKRIWRKKPITPKETTVSTE